MKNADGKEVMRLSGVHKIYDVGEARVSALDGVDLSLRKGEFVSVLGRHADIVS